MLTKRGDAIGEIYYYVVCEAYLAGYYLHYTSAIQSVKGDFLFEVEGMLCVIDVLRIWNACKLIGYLERSVA